MSAAESSQPLIASQEAFDREHTPPSPTDAANTPQGASGTSSGVDWSDPSSAASGSRVWGNDYDNGTFWTNDIAASYGIEMYPIHGGSMYLGHHLDYVDLLWNEITQNT